MLESANLCAQGTNKVHVLRDMVIDVQGVTGGVRLDVLGAVGVLQRVQGFLEG